MAAVAAAAPLCVGVSGQDELAAASGCPGCAGGPACKQMTHNPEQAQIDSVRVDDVVAVLVLGRPVGLLRNAVAAPPNKACSLLHTSFGFR